MHRLKTKKFHKQAFNIDVIMDKISIMLLERGATYVRDGNAVGVLFVGVKSDDDYEYTIRFDIKRKK